MVNGEDTSDGHSIIPSCDKEEHDDGASSSTESLAEAIPDPTVAQASEGIVAERANVGDGQAPAHLNCTVGGLTAVVAPAPAVDAANVGGVAIAAAPDGNPVAQIQGGVGVIANAVGPFVGAHNAGVVLAGVGAPLRVVHAHGVANAGGAVIAPAPFGVGGNPVALAQAGAGFIANGGGAVIAPVPFGVGGNPVALAQAGVGFIANGGGAPAGQAPVLLSFDLDAGLSGPPLRRSEVGSFF